MARSLDKAAWSGHAPLCALCLTPRAERRSQVHLTHGIAVWLCPAHGSSAFLRRRAGRDFVHTLGEVWRAAGVLTRRRERALAAHLQPVRRSRTSRPRPGSYAWPRLRREVEARAARGERPRAREEDPEVPSTRTVSRWLAEGRWLAPPGPGSPPRPAAAQPAHDRTPPSTRARPRGGADVRAP